MKLVYCPCRYDDEAREIARELLRKKLIACANVFPITSLYRWKGKKSEHAETVLLCKTTATRTKKVVAEIKKLHSYECPAIIVIDAKANKEFEKWVSKSTSL